MKINQLAIMTIILFLGADTFAQWTNYNTGNSPIIGNNTKAIAAQSDGRVWIGDSFNGLSEFDSGNWSVYDINNSGLPINGVLQLEIAPNGDKWIATNTKGIAVFNDVDWIIYNESNTNQLINFLVKSTISFDANGTAWIGGGSPSGWGGLIHFDGNIWEIYDPDNSNLWQGWHTLFATGDFDTFYAAKTGWGQVPYLYSFNITTGDTTSNMIPGGYNWTEVFGIRMDSQGVTWIATLDGLFKFDNGNWTHFHTTNSTIPSNDLRVLLVAGNDDIWLGTFGAAGFGDGIIKFDGQTFTQFTPGNSGLSDLAISALEDDVNGNLWVGHSNGVDVFEGAVVSIDRSSSPQSTQFELQANYPNPFNPITTIEFALSQPSSMVMLEVYDVIGQHVKTLNAASLAAGHHKFVWNATDASGNPAPSGVYFYRIQANNETETRKMILAK